MGAVEIKEMQYIHFGCHIYGPVLSVGLMARILSMWTGLIWQAQGCRTAHPTGKEHKKRKVAQLRGNKWGRRTAQQTLTYLQNIVKNNSWHPENFALIKEIWRLPKWGSLPEVTLLVESDRWQVECAGAGRLLSRLSAVQLPWFPCRHLVFGPPTLLSWLPCHL